jgi:hypothetical protein
VNAWYTNTLLSRLDDKWTGAIVIIMQRLHMEDLVGFVTRQSDEWKILNLPAIATYDQVMEVGSGKTRVFRAGEVLHPAREPLEILESYRALLGSDTFSAQYQQEPVPPGGAMIKRNWIVRFREFPIREAGAQIPLQRAAQKTTGASARRGW